MGEELTKEQHDLLSPELWDKGHRLDKAYGRCTKCKCHAIDLYEDMSYGPIRDCKP